VPIATTIFASAPWQLRALTGAEAFFDAADELSVAFHAGADQPSDRASRGNCGCEPARGWRLKSQLLASKS